MICPNCGLTNPDSAMWCDCGYDFMSRRMRGNRQDNAVLEVQQPTLAKAHQSMKWLTTRFWIVIGIAVIIPGVVMCLYFGLVQLAWIHTTWREMGFGGFWAGLVTFVFMPITFPALIVAALIKHPIDWLLSVIGFIVGASVMSWGFHLMAGK